MGDDLVMQELQELRKQVAELQADRQDQVDSVEQSASREESPLLSPHASADLLAQDPDPAEEEKSDLEKQIQEFVDALDEEIRDTNPMTVLVVFALGIVIGRFLPR